MERIWSAAVELYHLFDEFDPAARESAEAVIKAARDQLVPPTYLSAAAE